jgi:hypothetical protein
LRYAEYLVDNYLIKNFEETIYVYDYTYKGIFFLKKYWDIHELAAIFLSIPFEMVFSRNARISISHHSIYGS